MKLLAIDTATEMCSAALWLNGEIRHLEAEVARGHADLILSMVDELLRQCGCSLHEVSALVFGRGPGSFTGVRLAASVAQGLAFGVGIPVIPISDLQAVAQRVVADAVDNFRAPQRVLVCNDARMKEVYWACFQLDAQGLMQAVTAEVVTKPDLVRLPEGWLGQVGMNVYGAGRGFAAYPDLRDRPGASLEHVDPQVLPRAREVVLLAVGEAQAGRLLPADQAVPTYLRDNVAQPKS